MVGNLFNCNLKSGKSFLLRLGKRFFNTWYQVTRLPGKWIDQVHSIENKKFYPMIGKIHLPQRSFDLVFILLKLKLHKIHSIQLLIVFYFFVTCESLVQPKSENVGTVTWHRDSVNSLKDFSRKSALRLILSIQISFW